MIGEDKKTENAKNTASNSSHFAFFCRFNYYNLMASLNHLKALFSDVTSDVLNNCSF